MIVVRTHDGVILVYTAVEHLHCAVCKPARTVELGPLLEASVVTGLSLRVERSIN